MFLLGKGGIFFNFNGILGFEISSVTGGVFSSSFADLVESLIRLGVTSSTVAFY